MIGGNNPAIEVPQIIMDDMADSSEHNQEDWASKKPPSAAYEMHPLVPGFQPTELDVICARGKEAYNHPGNIRFRALVQEQLHNYSSSSSKMEKSKIVRDIIDTVRRASPQGGFVKKVDGEWFDVGERARREKTGQQIRDLLHTQYKSSTKAKARTRKTLRSSGNSFGSSRLPPRSISAPKSTGAAVSRARLPPKVVTLDSNQRNKDAIRRMAMQYRMRQNSEPDMTHPGVQPLQEWNIPPQRTFAEEGMSMNMNTMSTNFMQNQQSSLANQLQIQQQRQLLAQQQMAQEAMMMPSNQQMSQDPFNASQQSALMAMNSMGSFAPQQPQFIGAMQNATMGSLPVNSMGNSMTTMSPPAVGPVGPPFSSFNASNSSMNNSINSISNGMNMMSMMQPNNVYMNQRLGGSGGMDPMPFCSNDTSGSTMAFSESASSNDEQYGAFYRGHR